MLARTGLGEDSLGDWRHSWADLEPDSVADDVLAAAQLIAERRIRAEPQACLTRSLILDARQPESSTS